MDSLYRLRGVPRDVCASPLGWQRREWTFNHASDGKRAGRRRSCGRRRLAQAGAASTDRRGRAAVAAGSRAPPACFNPSRRPTSHRPGDGVGPTATIGPGSISGIFGRACRRRHRRRIGRTAATNTVTVGCSRTSLCERRHTSRDCRWRPANGGSACRPLAAARVAAWRHCARRRPAVMPAERGMKFNQQGGEVDVRRQSNAKQKKRRQKKRVEQWITEPQGAKRGLCSRVANDSTKLMHKTSAYGLTQQDTVTSVPRHWQKPLLGGVFGPTFFYDTQIHNTQPHHEETNRPSSNARTYRNKEAGKASYWERRTSGATAPGELAPPTPLLPALLPVAGGVVTGAGWRSQGRGL